MKLHNRLSLLIKYSGFTTFVLIAIVYGIFFGGMMSLGSFSGDGPMLLRFSLSALASGGAYFVIFTFAMAAVYILSNTKLFMSFNMTLKMIRQLWLDLVFFITIINGTILGLLVVLASKESTYTIRAMNMDLTQMTTHNWMLLAGLILITSLFLTQLVSLVCNIGNRFGAFFAFGVLALIGSIIVFYFQEIFIMIRWGEQMTLAAIMLTVITALCFGINFKMIQKTEVAR